MRFALALLIGVVAGSMATAWTVETTKRVTVLCPMKINNARGFWRV